MAFVAFKVQIQYVLIFVTYGAIGNCRSVNQIFTAISKCQDYGSSYKSSQHLFLLEINNYRLTSIILVWRTFKQIKTIHNQ